MCSGCKLQRFYTSVTLMACLSTGFQINATTGIFSVPYSSRYLLFNSTEGTFSYTKEKRVVWLTWRSNRKITSCTDSLFTRCTTCPWIQTREVMHKFRKRSYEILLRKILRQQYLFQIKSYLIDKIEIHERTIECQLITGGKKLLGYSAQQ